MNFHYKKLYYEITTECYYQVSGDKTNYEKFKNFEEARNRYLELKKISKNSEIQYYAGNSNGEGYFYEIDPKTGRFLRIAI